MYCDGCYTEALENVLAGEREKVQVLELRTANYAATCSLIREIALTPKMFFERMELPRALGAIVVYAGTAPLSNAEAARAKLLARKAVAA